MLGLKGITKQEFDISTENEQMVLSCIGSPIAVCYTFELLLVRYLGIF